jgi:hypothetical protein
MENSTSKLSERKKNFSIVIQIITSLYGLLYLYLVVCSFIPTENGNPVSDNPNFKPWDSEGIWVKIQFIVFLIGFYYSWKSRLTSGFIYLFWYAGMVAMSYYMASVLHREGAAFVLGFPILLISIILLLTGYRKRKSLNSKSDETNQ